MTISRAALVAVALSACSAPTKHERVLRSFHATVAADLAASGIANVLACGDVAISFEQFASGSSEPRACLARAFTTCAPARVDGTDMGMDSGPFYWSATVARGDAGCEVRLYKDDRNDRYGSHRIERRRCTGLSEPCAIVWTEDHMLCRDVATDAGASQQCSDLPPDVVYDQP
jgi:hypothetical protein